MSDGKRVPDQVILIGPPGAGKSTVGGLLARETASNFVDTDQQIESKIGKKIAEIFIEDGEEPFREVEKKVVLEALAGSKGVIALGGGAVLSDEVQEELMRAKQEGKSEVLFLDVTIAYAAPRVGFNKERPLLLVNPRASWQELMNKRRPIYSSLATRIIDTNERTPDEVVAAIIAGWE
jgi:shikimate kinase